MQDTDTLFDTDKHPHRRLNILTGEWVQVSPHRTKRPWQGKEENSFVSKRPDYDPGCYLCPGNTRANGNRNPDYSSVFVFDNDFGALTEEVPSGHTDHELLVARSERGICRVICFAPQHNLTLPEMSQQQLRKVVDIWVEQFLDLGTRPYINYVQIFENKGEIMGCSNHHPHGQIWAQETIPDEPAKELIKQKIYYDKIGSDLLGDYLKVELERKERLVTQNEDFVVLVPYWAFWPFETIVISRRPVSGFGDLNENEKDSLADIIKKITGIYDKVFNISFPYSAGFHPSPTDGKPHPEWRFHMHFYPPLLRSATIKKFSVGYEMLGNKQRDTTPELSAAILREVQD